MSEPAAPPSSSSPHPRPRRRRRRAVVGARARRAARLRRPGRAVRRPVRSGVARLPPVPLSDGSSATSATTAPGCTATTATRDSDVGGYNITRHAGVTMSLEQAAGAGLAESEAAAASAERGIEWALDRMYEGPGWRAFAGDGRRAVRQRGERPAHRCPRAASRADRRRALRRRARTSSAPSWWR